MNLPDSINVRNLLTCWSNTIYMFLVSLSCATGVWFSCVPLILVFYFGSSCLKAYKEILFRLGIYLRIEEGHTRSDFIFQNLTRKILVSQVTFQIWSPLVISTTLRSTGTGVARIAYHGFWNSCKGRDRCERSSDRVRFKRQTESFYPTLSTKSALEPAHPLLYTILFYSVLFYSILFCSILFLYSILNVLFCYILFNYILFCSILFYFFLFASMLYSLPFYYSVLFYSILLHSVPFYCMLFSSIQFCCILFCSVVFSCVLSVPSVLLILSYSITFCTILFYSILCYYILLHTIMFYSVVFCCILLCSILLYLILLCSILLCSFLFHCILVFSVVFGSILLCYDLFLWCCPICFTSIWNCNLP